jgi:adenylate cyclase
MTHPHQKKSKKSLRAVYGFGALVAFISIAAFIQALSWVDKPFQGFLIYDPPFVGSISVGGWPGREAGLSFLERVVSADGNSVARGQDVVSLARTKKPGTPIRYVLEGKGRLREVLVTTGVFSGGDFLFAFLVTFMGGVTLFILGWIVVLIKPNIRPSWVFFAICLGVGGYMVTSFEILTTYSLIPFHYLSLCFMPAPFFHLALIFPDRKKLLDRFPWLEYASYFPALVLAVLYQVHHFILPVQAGTDALVWLQGYRSLGTMARIFALGGAITLIGSVAHSLFKAVNPSARQRAKIILLGVTIAFLPSSAIMMGFYLLKVNFPWNFLVFFVIFFPAAIAYSIVKHNLFDADAIIKRTVGYAVVTAVLVGVYVLVGIVFNLLAGQYQVSRSSAFPIVFTLIIILIFNPLRNRIQSLVDRLFFRKEYDAKLIIDRLGTAMTSLMDLPQILRQMVNTFTRDMFIDNSAVLLLTPGGTSYQVRLSEGEMRYRLEGVLFEKSEPLLQVIEKEKKELTKDDVLEDPKYKDFCLDCAQNFSTLYASLIVPMILRGEVVGFLSLGNKKSGKFYNREDIDLLRTLATQGAVAIENARLAEQMKNEELVRANLARYLSPQIVDQIITKDVQVNLGGDRKKVTVLFSDIRNFTTISESMKPEQLVEFLNEYFTEMARIIFDHQGSLDKYIGDAIVAVFGSLIPLENPAEAAVSAAIEMMKEMIRLNERWENRYGFNMEMGIGVNTGEVFLGNIGSPERMEFTVIGDTVNTASRFSGLAKGRQILVTRATLSGLGPDFSYTILPPAWVKGKTAELEVFEIRY